jgi:hypothetical protein
MRSPYDVRAVDNVVVPAILFACCLAAMWRTGVAAGGARRWLFAAATVVFALFVFKSVAVAGQFGDRVSYLAGELRSLEHVRGAWRGVASALLAEPPLKNWDGRGSVQLRLAKYVSDCVPPSKRLLVLWPAPEIYYYSDRLMASRHLFFDAGYESLDVEERLTVEKIRRFAPPLALANGGLDTFTSRMYPGVVRYLHTEYEVARSLEEDGFQYLILVRRGEPVLGEYGEHGWPCFV